MKKIIYEQTIKYNKNAPPTVQYLEHETKYYAQQELLEIFNVSQRWANSRRIEYSEGLLDEEINALKRNEKLLQTCKDKDEWFVRDENIKIKEEIKKLEKKLSFLKLPQSKKDKFKSFNKDLIKKIPIKSLLDGPPSFKSPGREFYKCPLHSENTASFCVFKETNTWHCFGGCATGGDVINLYQKLNNVNFIEACRALTELA